MSDGSTTPFIKHIAGEFSDGLQHCVICGFVLADYRHAMVPKGQRMPGGWEPGPVYVSGNFYSAVLAMGETAEPCKP